MIHLLNWIFEWINQQKLDTVLAAKLLACLVALLLFHHFPIALATLPFGGQANKTKG